MALNLLRNSRVFFTTNVDTTSGVVAAANHTAALTSEIAVLEGFSFSQNTNSDTITISEAGTTPVRGQRTFNTSLAPVDFSFSTYIRPYKATNIKSEDAPLWNALSGASTRNTPLVKAGTFTSIAYATATNTVTIAGTTMSVTNLAVGDDVVINGLTLGTGTAAELKAVSGPARVVTNSGTSITLNMHNPSTVDVAAGAVAVTGINFYDSPWSEATTQAILGMHDSNRNQLQKFGMFIIVDSVTYQIDNAAMNQVTIDFGLDGIATAQWTGQATAITQLATTLSATSGTLTGGASGAYAEKYSGTANYITNKLSTATLKTVKALGTAATAATPYYVAITGGSVTITNNISYITPANLGVVNAPANYYTGTRSITGNLTAYLNTGAVTGFTGGGTGNLLKDMLAAASSVTEPMFAMELAIGGSANDLRVELQMPSVSISVPTVDAQAVISTAINFTAAASSLTGAATTSAYDLARTNDLTVRYYAAA